MNRREFSRWLVGRRRGRWLRGAAASDDAMRGTTDSAAAPAARCRKCLRWGSFMHIADFAGTKRRHILPAAADFGNWQGCRSNPDALPFFELHGYVFQRGLPQLLLVLHK